MLHQRPVDQLRWLIQERRQQREDDLLFLTEMSRPLLDHEPHEIVRNSRALRLRLSTRHPTSNHETTLVVVRQRDESRMPPHSRMVADPRLSIVGPIRGEPNTQYRFASNIRRRAVSAAASAVLPFLDAGGRLG